MSVFVKRKLKDGRRIRSRYGYDTDKVLISRNDFEGLLNDSDAAYEQAKQLQTIIENLERIKTEAARKALDKVRAEIEQRSYGVANDSVIRGAKYERAEILEIIDKYRAEQESEK